MLKSLKNLPLIKVLSLNSVSVMISFVLGIFSTKIVSLFLGASGMALMGSFRNFTSLFKGVSTLGINNSVIKLHIENKDDKAALALIYSTFFWFFLIVSTILGISILLFAVPISSYIFFSPSYSVPIRFFGILMPLIVVNVFWTAIYNALGEIKKIIVLQIISNVLIFAVTAYLIWKNNITGGLMAVASGELIMVLITLAFVLRDRTFFQFELKPLIDRNYLNVIWKFSSMALLSAIVGPIVLLLIRNAIVSDYSINDAGIWDAVNKLSGFYMTIFSSGLSLYYMPKLASLATDEEFKTELKIYFKVFVPLFLLMLVGVFLIKNILLDIAFSKEFYKIKDILVWQLAGDFMRIMTLAFGYQIVVKTMIKKYIFLELLFNGSYLGLAHFLIKQSSGEGALQAYFFANIISFAVIIFMFRKLIFNRKFSL